MVVGTTARSSPAPFVGRAAEVQRLLGALESATDGRPGMVLVCGDAGAGKTRLIHEFTGQAEQVGALVAAGAAAPLTASTVSYGPVVQGLRALAMAAQGLSETPAGTSDAASCWPCCPT